MSVFSGVIPGGTRVNPDPSGAGSKTGKTMRRIAFHLNCLTHGGAERVVTNLAGMFADEGYETIVATEWVDENEYPLNPKVRRVHVGLTEQDENRGRLAKIRIRERNLHRFLLTEKPDVLVSFAIKANYRALAACRGTGVPVVISVRIDPVAFYSGPVNSLMIRLLFDRASGAVFQTPDAKAFFAPRLQDNSVIIVNPITQKYIDVPTPDKRTRTIVNVGRLVDFKNQTMLVRAFARLAPEFPDYILRIYGPDSGDGSKESIEQAIHDCRLEHRVFLMGDCSTLEREIADAAVFAFSSDYEGMPNALMEAMAMGLPVVATDCRPGAARMLIRDKENGQLVPVGDPDAMAQAIRRYLNDPAFAKRCGDAARAIRDIANTRTVYEQWRDYLESITEHGKTN